MDFFWGVVLLFLDFCMWSVCLSSFSLKDSPLPPFLRNSRDLVLLLFNFFLIVAVGTSAASLPPPWPRNRVVAWILRAPSAHLLLSCPSPAGGGGDVLFLFAQLSTPFLQERVLLLPVCIPFLFSSSNMQTMHCLPFAFVCRKLPSDCSQLPKCHCF